MKRVVALVVLVLLIGAALLLVHGLTSASRTYPAVIDPGQAYILPNGTLYISVYNSWSNPVTVNSLQVAYFPAGEALGAYSELSSPNAALGDGGVKILCCTAGTGPQGNEQVLASSTEWKGGGTVKAGEAALLRFTPPAPITLAGGQSYYIAVGNQWLPTENLEPFVFTGTPNYALPNFIPTRAIIYPNETMQLAIIGTRQESTAPTASVSLRGPLQTGWLPGLSNVSYAVLPEGGSWYRLVPGRSLPPYMPLSEDAYDFGNYTSFAVYGMAETPLVFQYRLVSQVPPIIAPTAPESSESWSSQGSGQQLTMSYEVEWQVSPGGNGSYRFPVTLYGGQYRVNGSQEFQVQVGGVQLKSPATFNTSYFRGDLVVMQLGKPETNGSMDITLSYGPPIQGVQFNTVASSTTSLTFPAYLIVAAIAVVIAWFVVRSLRKPKSISRSSSS